MSQRVYFKGQVVGHIVRNLYVTKRNNNHVFLKFHGLAVSQEVINKLPEYVDRILFLFYPGMGIKRFLVKRGELINKAYVWDDGGDLQYVISFEDMTPILKRESPYTA